MLDSQSRSTPAGSYGAPTGSPLYGRGVPASSIGGSPTTFAVQPNITVTAGARCAIVIAAVNTTGCHGIQFSDENPYAGGAELCQGDGGAWTAEANRDLKSSTTVR